MLNFKIRIFDRCFAIKFSSKWLKMEKSQQVRVLSKQAANLVSQANQAGEVNQASQAKQANQAKQLNQAKQASQAKQSKQA